MHQFESHHISTEGKQKKCKQHRKKARATNINYPKHRVQFTLMMGKAVPVISFLINVAPKPVWRTAMKCKPSESIVHRRISAENGSSWKQQKMDAKPTSANCTLISFASTKRCNNKKRGMLCFEKVEHTTQKRTKNNKTIFNNNSKCCRIPGGGDVEENNNNNSKWWEFLVQQHTSILSLELA